LKNIIKISNIKNIVIPIIVGITIFFSCENDIEQVNTLTNYSEMPYLSAKNIETLNYDSSQLTSKTIAPRLERYEKDSKNPYMEFPEGLQAFFYNKYQEIESQLSANYAIFYEAEDIWEAKYNVICQGENGDILYTEYLKLDRKKETLSSDKYVKIIKLDGSVHTGVGFESRQDLTGWRIFDYEGETFIDE